MSAFRADLLPLVVLVPALMATACALYVRRRRRVGAALGDRNLVHRLAGEDLAAVPHHRVVVMVLAALALGLAAADPRWGRATESAALAPRDVVLVLDASNSMLVEDVAPNRLGLQQRAAHRLADALREDRVGLVAFAGDASVLSPPTRDFQAVRMFIDAVEPGIALQSGSSVGAAIRAGSSLLAAGPTHVGGRVLVLISDGEIVESEAERDPALEAARGAARLGIEIHTLGVGSRQGGPVPHVDPVTGRRQGSKVDPVTGAIAISALDEGMLRQLARETRGTYHHLSDAEAADGLIARLDAAGPRGRHTRGGEQHAPRYMWFVGLALILMASDILWERRARVQRSRPAPPRRDPEA